MVSNWRGRALGILLLCIGWAVLWGVIGALLSVVVGYVDPPSVDPGEGPVDLARMLAAVGALTGAAFGVMLAVFERRRRLSALRWYRAALWGAVAGGVIPLVSPAINDPVVLNTVPLGIVSAVLSATLAHAVERGGKRTTTPVFADPGDA